MSEPIPFSLLTVTWTSSTKASPPTDSSFSTSWPAAVSPTVAMAIDVIAHLNLLLSFIVRSWSGFFDRSNNNFNDPVTARVRG